MNSEEKIEYGYRLLLKISSGSSFSEEKNKVTINLGNRHIDFGCEDSKEIKNGSWFSFTEKGFKSEEEAYNAAKELKQFLLFTGFKMKIAFDFGFSAMEGYVNELRTKPLNKAGIQTLMYVHGIQVFRSNVPTCFMTVGKPTLSIERNLSEFQEASESINNSNHLLENKLQTALEIYHSISFESTVISQFILLVSIVEVLAERTAQEESVVLKIDELLANSDDWNDQQKGVIKESLLKLQKEISIGKATKNLIKKYRTRPEIEKWRSLYDLRSQLLHDGNRNLNLPEFKKDLGWLRKLVDELISKAFIEQE